MPRPVTMPIANDKRRRPERTEAIRILKPAISNIPKSVSATVAADANDTVNELGKRDVTAPVYFTKCAKSPQDTFFAPCGPHKPKRSATADRKEAPSANRANRRTICVPFSVSCAAFCEPTSTSNSVGEGFRFSPLPVHQRHHLRRIPLAHDANLRNARLQILLLRWRQLHI